MPDAVHFDPSIPDRQVTGESSASALTCSGSSNTDYRDVHSLSSESSYLALPMPTLKYGKKLIPLGRRTGCAYSGAGGCRCEEESVLQNMCNKRNERLNKPCKNGFCYCYTSDSDDIRKAGTSATKPSLEHHRATKPGLDHHRCKPLRKQYMYNLPTESDSSAIISSDQYLAEKAKAAQDKKKKRVTLPPEDVEGQCRAGNRDCGQKCGKDKCRRKHFQATNKFQEFHCSDSDAPLIHIIQEVQRNMVVSEIRINRSKLKGKPRKGRSGGVEGSSEGGGSNNANDPGNDGTSNNVRGDENGGGEHFNKVDEKNYLTNTKNKNINSPLRIDLKDDNLSKNRHDDGAKSDLNKAKQKSASSRGGRLLLKRVGPDATYQPSTGPPRKPPRNFSSSSDCSSIFSERIKSSSKRSKQKSLSSSNSIMSEGEQPTMPANFLLKQATPEPVKQSIPDPVIKNNVKNVSNNSLHKISSSKQDEIASTDEKLNLKDASSGSLNSVSSLPSSKGGFSKPTLETLNVQDGALNILPNSREEFTPSCPTYSQIASPNCSNINELFITNIPNVPNVPIQEPINELNSSEPRKSLTNLEYAKINFAATSDIPNPETIGWVPSNIYNMLNPEAAHLKFDSQQPLAEPQQEQVGWQPPPKLQIDSVDGKRKGRENEDFHNFAVNMACKSTPVKPDIPKDEVTPQKLLKENVKNLPPPTTPTRLNTTNKMPPVTECSRTNDEAPVQLDNVQPEDDQPEDVHTEDVQPAQKSFQKRALRQTKSFLENSKHKLLGLAKRKDDRKRGPAKEPKYSPKTVGTQTSESVVLHGRRLDFEYASDDTLNRRSITPLEGDELAKVVTKPTHHSDDGFDFSRKVNSPKIDRSSQRKQHNFSPRHFLRNLQTNTEKVDAPEQSYKSYASDFNEDFTVAVQDLLGKARAKLEGEQTASEKGQEMCTDESVQDCIIAAEADIHHEPIYAEINEQNGRKDAEIQLAVPHDVAVSNPSAVYARILKKPKAPQQTTPHRPAPQPPVQKFRMEASAPDISVQEPTVKLRPSHPPAAQRITKSQISEISMEQIPHARYTPIQHQTIEHQALQDQTIQPEAAQYKAIQPQVLQHEALQLQAIQPQAAQQQATQHQVTQPQAIKRRATQRQTIQPQAVPHKATQSLAIQPQEIHTQTIQRPRQRPPPAPQGSLPGSQDPDSAPEAQSSVRQNQHSAKEGPSSLAHVPLSELQNSSLQLEGPFSTAQVPSLAPQDSSSAVQAQHGWPSGSRGTTSCSYAPPSRSQDPSPEPESVPSRRQVSFSAPQYASETQDWSSGSLGSHSGSHGSHGSPSRSQRSSPEPEGSPSRRQGSSPEPEGSTSRRSASYSAPQHPSVPQGRSSGPHGSPSWSQGSSSETEGLPLRQQGSSSAPQYPSVPEDRPSGSQSSPSWSQGSSPEPEILPSREQGSPSATQHPSVSQSRPSGLQGSPSWSQGSSPEPEGLISRHQGSSSAPQHPSVPQSRSSGPHGSPSCSQGSSPEPEGLPSRQHGSPSAPQYSSVPLGRPSGSHGLRSWSQGSSPEPEGLPPKREGSSSAPQHPSVLQSLPSGAYGSPTGSHCSPTGLQGSTSEPEDLPSIQGSSSPPQHPSVSQGQPSAPQGPSQGPYSASQEPSMQQGGPSEPYSSSSASQGARSAPQSLPSATQRAALAPQGSPSAAKIPPSTIQGAQYHFLPLPSTPEPPAVQPSTSFNNSRERNSPPKARALSKSDLSQSSEIFLENLFQTKNSNVSPRSDDEKRSNLDGAIAVSQFYYFDSQHHGDSSNSSFSSDPNSSKPSSDDVDYEEPCGEEMQQFEISPAIGYVAINYDDRSPETGSYESCQSYQDKDENMNISPTKDLNVSTSKANNKYQNLKFKIRASFRKGKNYLKKETKRLSVALDRSFSKSENAIHSNKRKSDRGRKGEQSDFEVDYISAIELLNETSKGASVKRQLEQTVSLCRQLPEFETSSEMVEAERLLLYSTLKENSFCKSDDSIPSHHSPPKDFCSGTICITSFEVPIKPDIHYDAFFNYFYIGVFSHDRDIRSTQSAEKIDNAVFFSNCNMIFDVLTANFEINVDIYVLRLRKLSSPPIQKESGPIKIRKSSLSDSREEVVSRFRMHGNFIIRSENLEPFDVKSNSNNISRNSEFSLVANNLCSIPINLFSRNINLMNEAWLTANIVYNFKNFELNGFLNVGDIHRKHDWNKRWCQIDALTLYFWNYPQECSIIPPILTINLAKCVSYPIKSANREICPKPRSFQLDITTAEIIDEEYATDTFLFSTENQEDYNYWVNGLNDVVEFIRTWKVQVQ